MSESGLWHKGVSFALIALIVLMLFIAAVTLTPTAGAQETEENYTYVPDRHPSSGQLPLDIGETSDPWNVMIAIDWGATEPRENVETTMNWSCECNGDDPDDVTTSMFFDIQPLTFNLNASNGYSQMVIMDVTSLGGATEPSVGCTVKAWEISPPPEPMGQGTGVHVYIRTQEGPPPTPTPTPTTTPTPGPGGCFVATAAYGTEAAEEIDVLRAFRDEVLLESTLGAQFVEWYYQTSPPVADFIAENSLLRTIVRELVIDPMVSVATFTQGIWGK